MVTSHFEAFGVFNTLGYKLLVSVSIRPGIYILGLIFRKQA